MYIHKEDLIELEFPELLQEIIPYAYSPKTAERIRASSNANGRKPAFTKKTSEYLTSYESSNAIPFSEYEDIEAELKVMHIENFRLENAAFIKIKTLRNKSGNCRNSFPCLPKPFLFCWKK